MRKRGGGEERERKEKKRMDREMGRTERGAIGEESIDERVGKERGVLGHRRQKGGENGELIMLNREKRIENREERVKNREQREEIEERGESEK